MKSLTCIVCPNGCSLTIDKDNNGQFIVQGNLCEKGRDFAIRELTNPTRTICSTVKTNFSNIRRIPVRTDREIPLESIVDVMKEINNVCLENEVGVGDIIVENVSNTGANIIATSNICREVEYIKRE